MGNKSLKYATYQNTDTWSFKNKFIYCKILKIYDGDTLWGAIKINRKVYKIKIRLEGIDTPELKPPKSQKNRDKEIEAAKKSKDYLIKLIDKKIVKIKCGDFDKYGRLLATIFKIERKCYICQSLINVNELMITNNFAKRYDGGTKEVFV